MVYILNALVKHHYNMRPHPSPCDLTFIVVAIYGPSLPGPVDISQIIFYRLIYHLVI